MNEEILTTLGAALGLPSPGLSAGIPVLPDPRSRPPSLASAAELIEQLCTRLNEVAISLRHTRKSIQNDPVPTSFGAAPLGEPVMAYQSTALLDRIHAAVQDAHRKLDAVEATHHEIAHLVTGE